MPYGYNAFYDLGRNVAAVARGAQNGSAALANIASTFIDAFNPIGGSDNWLNIVSPTLLDPVVDIERNRDFADRPIMPDQPQYDTPKPDSQRYWGSVSPLLKVTADKLNEITGGNHFQPGAIDVSPETMEHWANFVGGAAGAFVKRALVDLPAKLATGDDIVPNDIPFARKVVGRNFEGAGLGAFYERAEEIEGVFDAVKGLREEGAYEQAADAQAENRDLLALRNLATKVRKNLRDIRRQIQAVAEIDGIDATERRRRTDALEARRKAELDAFNKAYVERVKKPRERERAIVPVE
jgi:hypothetical protein